MRIRKRQPQALPLLAVNIPGGNPGVEYFVGQNSCTCCTRQRQLQYWEVAEDVGKEYVEEEEAAASKGFGAGGGGDRHDGKDNNDIQVFRRVRHSIDHLLSLAHSELARFHGIEFEDVAKLSPTLESLGEFERVRGNEDNIGSSGGRTGTCTDGRLPCSEGDVNHPGGEPNESLLYSLYCVFSKLSGKAVLTAREALSRIMEQRLPGLDEKLGLPSVQVAKVMRSNPYFVPLEGGKFFLCSGPSTGNKDGEPRIASHPEIRETSLSSNLRQKIAPLNGLSNTESLRKDQQPVRSAGVRFKRTRSKGPSTEGGNLGRIDYRSRSAKKEGVTGFKAQSSVLDNSKDVPGISVPICKRYDGRGWKCNEKALEGYSMCRHHHELIVNRLARLRSSGRLLSKKSAKKRRGNGKQLKEAISVNEGELTVNSEQSGPHWWKNGKARSLKSINN